ncbi:DUF6208 family protein [Geminocystis sp. NIES-3709]|uniref:DUF6208 family protein n=1 Tax=Geminocystis sp. NIES-3709 TaxID=1617448 RepID=UPI0005FC7075|nr:DUF6208 family protein [Geminocystis sp. NIES-3709]BAQ65820.1 hypothetical protein GM3709_2585 [Geminocystis sp. NIES-3709]
MNTANLFFTLDILLAFLSFIFAKINKLFIGNLYTLYLIFNKKKSKQWRVIDNDLVASSLNLGVLMTKAPRWNTHAIIGTLGPFSVNNSLSIDLKSGNNSCESWIAIFYNFPDYQTITTIESNQVNKEEDWHSINLKKGKYTIGLRYYNYFDRLILPAVKIDGETITFEQEIPKDSNRFYETLINRKNFYFLAIHYYIYTIFKYRKYLSESFVKNEFLPVGATDTEFFYDYLDKGESLIIEVDEFTLKTYDIYITVYDRCSLPISFFKLCELKQNTMAIKNKGYYLIRVRRNENLSNKFADLNINLTKKEITYPA